MDLEATVAAWARQYPRIAAVHLFGSRAKGLERPDSDIDIAVTITEKEDDTATGYAICEGDRLRETLAPLLPFPLDLQFAFPDDSRVMPAVKEYGIQLYSAAGQ